MSESTTNPAANCSNDTDVAPVNPEPVIVTTTPPTAGTHNGSTAAIDGRGPDGAAASGGFPNCTAGPRSLVPFGVTTNVDS